MRIFDAGGAVVRVDGNRWLGGGEQSAALNQFLSADSIGEEAEVANADQAGGQHVEQEAANELDRIQGHGLGAGVIGVVFPVKADTAVFQRAKSVVAALMKAGDVDTLQIVGEIVTGAGDAPPDEIEKPIEAALEFVAQNPSAAWKVVWRVVQRNDGFAKRLFTYYAVDPYSHDATLFLDGLAENQLAELYILLSKYAATLGTNEETEKQSLKPRAFELNTANRDWYWLSVVVMNTLIQRGTPEAVQAIRLIDERAPMRS